MSSRPTSVPASRPKTTLFCPDCGHESVVGGDWTVHEEDGRRRYECPECAATVASRRRPVTPA